MPLFADTPGSRSLESMMTAVPGFGAKGHGVYIFGRKELTAEDCDCRLCLYYRKKGKSCSLKQCPFITERIFAGAASRKEIFAELAAKINVPAFQRRIRFHNQIYPNERAVYGRCAPAKILYHRNTALPQG